ncbi:hypothetical protein MUP51_01820 [Candidatus Bathyarchaeota archaeon]|nr:hypothetical protein [Candidatus Bathyarchaeota archaeon]
MRLNLYLLVGVLVYGFLVVYCPVEIAPMPMAQHYDQVFTCTTVEHLYNASNLIIRGRPTNIEIYYQNDPVQSYTIEVSEVYKGSCEDTIQVQTSSHGLLNKHTPVFSEEKLETCEVLLFLTKSMYSISVIDVNRGYFIIDGDNVTSIGVIDEDFKSVTNGLHQPMSLDEFTRSYLETE